MIPFRRSISKKQILLVVLDLLVLTITPFITIHIFFITKFGFGFTFHSLRFNITLYVTNIVVFMTIFFIMDLHDFKRNYATAREFIKIIIAIGLGWICSVFISYLLGNPPMGRGISFIYLSCLTILMFACRYLYARLAATSKYKKKAMIIGAGSGGQAVISLIKNNPQIDIEIACIFDNDIAKKEKIFLNIPFICREISIREAARQYKPELLVLAMRSNRYAKNIGDLIWCSHQGIEIQDLVSIFEHIEGRIPLKYIGEDWILYSLINKPRFYFKRVKRLTDLVFSLIALIATAPLLAIIALAIKLETKGPAFYRQTRVGLLGHEFKVLKLRSMIDEAEKETGPVWSGKTDARVTRVGKLIRTLRIDELPQFVNVIRGEMSLVGPRPERPEFVQNFIGENGSREEIIPFYGERLTIKPGLTGWAQINYSYAASFDQAIRKLEYDFFYIKNMSVFLDAAIILKTIKVVILGKGVK